MYISVKISEFVVSLLVYAMGGIILFFYVIGGNEQVFHL